MNMKQRLTKFDTAVIRKFKNDGQFDIGGRFFDFRNQNIQINLNNVSENIDPVTSLALMQRVIYDLSKLNITSFNSSTSTGKRISLLIGNFTMLYDQLVDYKEKEYFTKQFGEEFMSNRKQLILYLYMGSLFIFFLLAIFRTGYHIETYNCKSGIFEIVTKLTDKDVNEMYQHYIKPSLSSLDQIITINESKFYNIAVYITQKFEQFKKARIDHNAS